MAEIETDLQELQSVSDSVAEYFCEDPSKFKLEECCSIFKSFCEKFLRAMQVSMYTGMFSFRQKTILLYLLTAWFSTGKQGSGDGRGEAETQR